MLALAVALGRDQADCLGHALVGRDEAFLV
jgi:hypothetical protein